MRYLPLSMKSTYHDAVPVLFRGFMHYLHTIVPSQQIGATLVPPNRGHSVA